MHNCFCKSNFQHHEGSLMRAPAPGVSARCRHTPCGLWELPRCTVPRGKRLGVTVKQSDPATAWEGSEGPQGSRSTPQTTL